MITTKPLCWLAALGLLSSFQSYGVVYSEAQTAAITENMQHALAVENTGIINEGHIHDIYQFYASNKLAVGIDDHYLHTFFAKNDNTISYMGKQSIGEEDYYSNRDNISLSPDAKFMYLKKSKDNIYQIEVMTLDSENKEWETKFTYTSIGTQSIDYGTQSQISDDGNYLIMWSSYQRNLSIAKRDKVTGELSPLILVKSDKLPSRVEGVEYDEANQTLLIFGQGSPYDSTSALIALKIDSINGSATEIARLPLSGTYQNIDYIQFDPNTKNIFIIESGNINVYHLDETNNTLTTSYSDSTYNTFNTYVSSKSVRLIDGKLFVQQSNNLAKIYRFNDGTSPSFSLEDTVTTSVYLNQLAIADGLGWRMMNEKAELFANSSTAYDFVKKDTLADGQQNMPIFGNSRTQIAFIESLDIIVAIDRQGIYSMLADASAQTPLYSTTWEQLGFDINASPFIDRVVVKGNNILLAGRYFNYTPSSQNDRFMALKVDDKGVISTEVKPLTVSGNPFYYQSNNNSAQFDPSSGVAAFLSQDGGYAFFSLDADNNPTFIDTLDSALFNTYYYYRSIGFVDGKPYVWDRENAKFYFVDVDVANKDVDLGDGIDLSGSVPNDAVIITNGKNIYFINDSAVSSYKINDDLSLSFMSTSFVSGLYSNDLTFISEDYVVNANYNSLNSYAIDRQSGAWKKLESIMAEDLGVSGLNTSKIAYGDSVKQNLIFNANINYSTNILIRADLATSPVLTSALLPLLANEGEKVERNISEFVFDADNDDQLIFSSANLPSDAELTESGVLTYDTTSHDSGELDILVTDSNDMTLSISLPFLANRAPVVEAIDTYWINPGENITFNLADAVSDSEGQDFSFTKDEGSALEVNALGMAYGQLTQAGEHQVLATVTDTLGAKASVSATVQVNSAPTASGLGAVSLKAGEAVTRDLASAFADADGHALSFSAIGLPSGISLSAQGQLSGSSKVTGKSSVVVTATDTMGLSTSANLSVDIKEESSGGGSLGYLVLLLLPLAIRRKFH
ncbi:putative Ig domain-containing protein [Shewanella aegiceratis]|uniref:putative Ig domain-containing protein n=1 Tax=Shewanella aegiceratis TaxID=2864203 RepID=UPI001C657F69|nr:putative Ig domain-containing protein [Shewanella aegiceratis]QYJ83330.1 Ig domain-containing protein [Shewanella aegiceratis]